MKFRELPEDIKQDVADNMLCNHEAIWDSEEQDIYDEACSEINYLGFDCKKEDFDYIAYRAVDTILLDFDNEEVFDEDRLRFLIIQKLLEAKKPIATETAYLVFTKQLEFVLHYYPTRAYFQGFMCIVEDCFELECVYVDSDLTNADWNNDTDLVDEYIKAVNEAMSDTISALQSIVVIANDRLDSLRNEPFDIDTAEEWAEILNLEFDSEGNEISEEN